MSTKKFFRSPINWLILILLGILLGYVGYRLYDAAIKDATRRIRQEVAKEITGMINPLKWPEKIFGHKRKKS